MKRRIRCLLLVLMFCLVLCVGAAAAEQTGAQLSYVTDAAGLLSENENMLLEKMAESVSQKYGVGVYIVTVEDYRDFHSEGVYKATYTIYHEYTMGEGPNRDGIMLLLSMDDRDWAMFCYGSRCEYAFNSYGQQKLEKVFLDNFREDDWYGGFADYIAACGRYLEANANGAPIDVEPSDETEEEYEPLSFGDKLFFAALMAFRFGLPLGLIVAFIVCAVYKRQLKSVRRATEAARYTVSGGAEITAREDRFTHTTEVRTPIKTESDDHDSGPSFSGGTTVNSGGFSHSGGKF